MFKRMLSWGKSNTDQELEALESQLLKSYMAVEPRKEYVAGLKQRLQTYSQTVEVVPQTDRKVPVARAMPALVTADVVVAALGVLSGAALLVVGIRAVIAAVAAVGLARHLKSGLEPKRQLFTH